MSDSNLPMVVREFVQEYLQNHEHVEVLLLLCRDADRGWVAREVAAELRIDPASASAALDYLAGRDLLDVRRGGIATYRYRPTSAKLNAAVAAFADAHDRDRLGIMILLSDNALKRLRLSALRAFAEAFRLRGPKGDK